MSPTASFAGSSLNYCYPGRSLGGLMEALRLSADQRAGTMIVTLQGDLDIVTSSKLDECLEQARVAHRSIIIDLSEVDFMDTSALAVIVRHWKKLGAAGGSLALAGARYRYTKTLWITGLADRLTLYPSVKAGLATLRAASDGQSAAAPGNG